MSNQNVTDDKRQKLIEDAMAQCQKTRKVLEEKMPAQFAQIKNAIIEVSKEGKIRSTIAHVKNEGADKAHAVETIQKYLDLSSSNKVFKQSVKTLLERHKH